MSAGRGAEGKSELRDWKSKVLPESPPAKIDGMVGFVFMGHSRPLKGRVGIG